MQTTTLPIFRIAGISATVARTHAQQTAMQLREQFQANPPSLPAFSHTLYCAYQYPDADHVKITFGKLIANDVVLNDGITDAWVAPQNYAVFTPDQPEQYLDTWAEIMANPDLNRRFHTDFETHSAQGASKIYIGLMGEVEIEEEIF